MRAPATVVRRGCLGVLAGLAGLAALNGGGDAARAEPAASPGSASGALTVRFEGLRSARGLIRACLTRDPAHFPKCEDDPAAMKASIAASPAATLSFAQVPPGDYALLILHDENGNARLDTTLGIPREGIGFSRNPRIMFGPPKFEATVIHIGAGVTHTTVKLRYFL